MKLVLESREDGHRVSVQVFEGRCRKHKRFDPSVQDPLQAKASCTECAQLINIWVRFCGLQQAVKVLEMSQDVGSDNGLR